MATKTRKAQNEQDMLVLRLAAADLDALRTAYYEDLAELYGDRPLYEIASSLRTRGLIGWGSNWTRCWLTLEGERVIEKTVRTA